MNSAMPTEEQTVNRFNTWVGLAKNFAWVVGILLLGMYKFQQLENQNDKLTMQLLYIREEHIALERDLNDVRAKQLTVLLRLEGISKDLEIEKSRFHPSK